MCACNHTFNYSPPCRCSICCGVMHMQCSVVRCSLHLGAAVKNLEFERNQLTGDCTLTAAGCCHKLRTYYNNQPRSKTNTCVMHFFCAAASFVFYFKSHVQRRYRVDFLCNSHNCWVVGLANSVCFVTPC